MTDTAAETAELTRPDEHLFLQLTADGADDVAAYRLAYRKAARQCGVGLRSAKLTREVAEAGIADDTEKGHAAVAAIRARYVETVSQVWANRDALHARARTDLARSSDPLVRWVMAYAAHRLDWAIVAMSKAGTAPLDADAFAKARDWCEDWQELSILAWNAGVLGELSECGSCSTPAADHLLTGTRCGAAVLQCPECHDNHLWNCSTCAYAFAPED